MKKRKINKGEAHKPHKKSRQPVPFGGRHFEGVVDMHSPGNMHVAVEGMEHDIYVTPRHGLHALHEDRVELVVIGVDRAGVPEGEIVRIVERSTRSYVGRVEITQGFAFVSIDSRKMPADLFIAPPLPGELKQGQKVAARAVEWPMSSKNPVGKITQIFGMEGDNDAEMHAILAEFDLPYHFEKQVEQAAEAIPGEITERDYAERRDMRGVTTFTIDPADAKDFDDALSLRALEAGWWEVGVHIADVTHYVREGSIVDVEGEERATSVYLVDRTVPMLPERLSNFLCSLRPDEEKLCFSAIFEINDEGQIRAHWIGRTVIRSDRRFAYEEAQALIEGAEGDFKAEVLTLNAIARKLRAERFRRGSITFEREEAKFRLDADGKPLGVYFKEQKESNQLIEEFMLLANRTVAEFAGKKRADNPSKRTFVYRVHDSPNDEKLQKFSKFIQRFGYKFELQNPHAIAPQMNALMEQIKDKAEENVVSTLAIRTMAKAFYSTDNIGHYGLGFPYYTHFTSPIRRYPDMMVHRLLAHYLAGGKSPDKGRFEKLCDHSSEREVLAAQAERASVKYKMVEFMVDKIGCEFDGLISGVTEWGIYVELIDTHIEGMVALRDMPGDHWSFDEEDYAVTGHATGRTFTLGDKVRISVLRADLQRKQLDFLLTASYDFDSDEAVPLLEPVNVSRSKRR